MKPNFIIAGAPKCGTTSLHAALNEHPDISLPDAELFYFDADDYAVHPTFRGRAKPTWEQYLANFNGLPSSIIGEDTTTYLMSERAPERIARAIPDAKIILMLRDPIERCWSQYWHNVAAGRTYRSFEMALETEPTILMGSRYASGVRRFRDLFRDVLVLRFEDFKEDTVGVTGRAMRFLGVPPISSPQWANKTAYPTPTTLLMNRLGTHLAKHRYKGGFMGRIDGKWQELTRKTLTDNKPKPMKAETRKRLAEILAHEIKCL